MRILQLLLVLSSALAAQDGATVSLSNGLQMTVSSSFGKPAAGAQIRVDMEPASGDSFYRVFRDGSGLAIFAYELQMAKGGGTDVQVFAKSAGVEFAKRYPGIDGGKPVPTLSTTIRLNASPLKPAEIPLFEIEGQGFKVIDSVRVFLPGSDRAEKTDAGQPINRFLFDRLQIAVGGQVLKSDTAERVTGRFAMWYIPGRGGFFFAAEKPDASGFVKAGTIYRNKLTFTIGNQLYECTANSPLLTKSDAGELWVLHDPAYRPAGNWTAPVTPTTGEPADQFFAAASDSLRWWLRAP